MKKIFVLALMFATMGASQAYFRCNTMKCKEARMADKQERLANQIASADSSSEKQKAEIELATLIEEMKEMGVQPSSTAFAR